MMTDNALADFTFLWNVGSGDTGERGAEHRSFLLLWFTHTKMQEIRQNESSC
ncbi:MAG: hypothetical protein ACXAEN_04160 [Candidatus Thorarchaeota archaeon]|jgi:hypothetical protein